MTVEWSTLLVSRSCMMSLDVGGVLHDLRSCPAGGACENADGAVSSILVQQRTEWQESRPAQVIQGLDAFAQGMPCALVQWRGLRTRPTAQTMH